MGAAVGQPADVLHHLQLRRQGVRGDRLRRRPRARSRADRRWLRRARSTAWRSRSDEPLHPPAGELSAEPGSPHPLGARVVVGGTRFSVFSRNAGACELLLFDGVDDAEPARVIRPRPDGNRTYHYWHVFVPGLRRRARSTATGRTARSTARAALRFDRRQGPARSLRARRRRPDGLRPRRCGQPGRQRRARDEERGRRSRRATTGKATRRSAGRSRRPSSTRCTSAGFTAPSRARASRRRRAGPTPG